VSRATKETDIAVELNLDGSGSSSADTGIPFFDHMLQQLGKHAGWDLDVTCRGDLQVDGHHTVEDCGIAIGTALAEALGDKAGIRRFASVTVPLDEAAVEVSLDLAGRNFVVHEVPVPYETIDGFDTGLLEDFVRAFSQASNMTIHVHLRYGRSPHHICEAQFKAMAKALGDACSVTERGGVPSTKGTLIRGPDDPHHRRVDYGSGNLHPSRAIARVGGSVRRATPAISQRPTPRDPQVGHFGWYAAICHDRAIAISATGRPIFGVCVDGAFGGSDEIRSRPGVLPGWWTPRRRRRCPGWNTTTWGRRTCSSTASRPHTFTRHCTRHRSPNTGAT
jgi:imidazoleglycerol-phosphate dehydratase